MKNHDKASLPKIQIKQVQVLNRVLGNNIKNSNAAGYAGMAGTTTVDTSQTTTTSGIF
ncbi:hypothetical protein [Mucilaginibacter celer]|uniref:hypothetical protein n=1 Tax=Mucilaginibacter celer TaxID=2305508 RepID=UPI0013CE91B0|nr:hypothetical protein [Mucilaginibacter celer]